MASDTLKLWFAYPNDLVSEQVARSCKAILSESEVARARAFKFVEARREFVAAHALVRTALSHSSPQAADSWSFRTNAYGKPEVEPPCGLRFNLSRSRKLVACVIAEQIELGIDLEAQERAGEISQIISSVLSPSELIQYGQLAERERPDRALSLWTLKESFTKACGVGLSVPLRSISFLLGDQNRIRLEVDADTGLDPNRWQFCLFEHAGHRMAVAAERGASLCFEFYESRPLLASPVQLAKEPIPWFFNDIM